MIYEKDFYIYFHFGPHMALHSLMAVFRGATGLIASAKHECNPPEEEKSSTNKAVQPRTLMAAAQYRRRKYPRQ
jgi:hypothetical protein